MGTDREAKLGPVARWRLMPDEPWMERSASGEWVKLDDVRKTLSTPPEATPEPPTPERTQERIAKFRARAFQDALAIGNTVAPRLGADGVAQVQEVIVRAMVAAYVAAAPTPEPERPAERCVWRENDFGGWDTGCQRCWTFNDGGPTENRVTFCFYCGKPLSVEEDPHAGE